MTHSLGTAQSSSRAQNSWRRPPHSVRGGVRYTDNGATRSGPGPAALGVLAGRRRGGVRHHRGSGGLCGHECGVDYPRRRGQCNQQSVPWRLRAVYEHRDDNRRSGLRSPRHRARRIDPPVQPTRGHRRRSGRFVRRVRLPGCRHPAVDVYQRRRVRSKLDTGAAQL